MDMMLIYYVDDLLLLGEDLSKIEDVKRQLGKLYQMKDLGPTDEPPHQIHSYTLPFSLFLHFLYITDPPLCTSTLM